MIYKMIQKVGDRDNPSLSIKDIAFTINANPMSDRLQKVIEVYEEHDTDMCKRGRSDGDWYSSQHL